MQTEIEAKFLDIDPEKIRQKLKSVGAIQEYPERLMRRSVFEHPTEKQNDWFRVRDEGDKITLSYKILTDRTLHGTKEITIEVNNFDDACNILKAAKLKFVAYQETKREMWTFGDTKITIDTWPWIPTFTEIEAGTEKEVRETAEKLGLNWEDTLHGSVETAYQKYYDVTEEEVDNWKSITFVPVPDWLEKKWRK